MWSRITQTVQRVVPLAPQTRTPMAHRQSICRQSALWCSRVTPLVGGLRPVLAQLSQAPTHLPQRSRCMRFGCQTFIQSRSISMVLLVASLQLRATQWVHPPSHFQMAADLITLATLLAGGEMEQPLTPLATHQPHHSLCMQSGRLFHTRSHITSMVEPARNQLLPTRQ